MKKFTIDYTGTSFLETSQTDPNPTRLNWRCEMLLTRNQKLLEGQRVLDLASHDARFTYACLRLGARSVTGVEGRPHLIENAKDNLKQLGFDESRFQFESGDIFEWLPRFEPESFDVVLCFGFLYHTIRQVEFFQQMARLRPKHLILDTNVERFRGWELIKLLRFVHRLRPGSISPGRLGELWRSIDAERDALFFRPEDSREEGSTIEQSNFIAVPTAGLLEKLMRVNGFAPRRISWRNAGIDDFAPLPGYDTGWRVSYVGDRIG